MLTRDFSRLQPASAVRFLHGNLYFTAGLPRLLQSTDRTRHLTDFITPIRLRGSAQISLVITIRHLSEFARALSRRVRLIMLSYSGDVEIVE
jgi:hypothetical protein